MILKPKPAFLILSETILPAKATKGPAIAVYSGKDLSWETQDVFVLHFEVSPFCSDFFRSRFRVGHCCGSKPGKLMMYISQGCIVVPFDGVVAHM